VNSEITPYSFKHEGKTFVIVDTPGFNDSHVSDRDILMQILGWLKTNYQNGQKLNGILYLHRIDTPRIGGAALRNYMMFMQLCGEDFYRNICLGTTHWGLLKDTTTGESREAELKEQNSFWHLMIAKGSEYVRIPEDQGSALDIIFRLAARPPAFLKSQVEMGERGLSFDEVSATKALNQELEKLIKENVRSRQLEEERLREAQRRREMRALEERTRQTRVEEEERRRKQRRERMLANSINYTNLHVGNSQAPPPAAPDWDASSIVSLESAGGSTFSWAGESSTSHSSMESLSLTARQQLLAIFGQDESLQPLFIEALKRISEERFIRNFRRFIKRYCAELRSEAREQSESSAIVLIRKQAIWIASQICNLYGPSNSAGQLKMSGGLAQDADKLLILDRFLATRNAVPEEPKESQDRNGGSGDEDSGSSSESNFSDPEFPNINHLQAFLTEGPAFESLRTNIRNFVHPAVVSSELNTKPTSFIDRHILSVMQIVLQKLIILHRLWSAVRASYLSSVANACTGISPKVGATFRYFGRPDLMEGSRRLSWRCVSYRMLSCLWNLCSRLTQCSHVENPCIQMYENYHLGLHTSFFKISHCVNLREE
jgi:hypothetical protein